MKKLLAVLVLLTILTVGCQVKDNQPYTTDLEERVAAALERNQTFEQSRPNYLPDEMFSLLPVFPQDFYSVRQLIRAGTIKDLGALGADYWMQPEFFPNFEDIGLAVLQTPPENRWGAYGYLAYPADTISSIRPGESLDIYFFVKSSYLVETYQGIMFEHSFPATASVLGGELPDGSSLVEQNASQAAKYLTVKIEPNPFVLEPNFPVFRPGGTVRVKATITAAPETPPGNYAVAFDTGKVPKEQEDIWLKQYLNLYVSGTMTKISKPYHQAFLVVPGKEVI